MAQIGFYHLTRTAPDAALPDLLGRTLSAGQRAVVRAGSEARAAAIDKALWAAEKPDWLPHGTARTGHPAWQPIWIAAAAESPDGENPDAARPNGARFLFLLDGTGAPPGAPLDTWERVFDLFDGSDEAAVAAARARWAAAKAAGHTLTYWKQTASGWEKAS